MDSSRNAKKILPNTNLGDGGSAEPGRLFLGDGSQGGIPNMFSLESLSHSEIDTLLADIPGGKENVKEIYPLTSVQEEFLHHHLLTTVGDVYLMNCVYKFADIKGVEAFLAGYQFIVDRYDTLRSVFRWEGVPRPVQIVLKNVKVHRQELWFDPKKGDVKSQIIDHLNSSTYRIDIRKSPPLQHFYTFDKENSCWILVQVAHHLIADQASLNLIGRDLIQYFEGKQSELRDPIPFRDYVLALVSNGKRTSEEFFKNMLGDLTEPTAPFGITKTDLAGLKYNSRIVQFDGLTRGRIRDLSKRHRVSPVSIFHVVFALVLSRISGQRKAAFGTVFLDRYSSIIAQKEIFGPRVNTIPVRIQVEDTSVVECVRSTNELLKEIREHVSASISDIKSWTTMPTESPMILAVFNYFRDMVADAGVVPADQKRFLESVRPLQIDQGIHYPLSLDVIDRGDVFDYVVKAEVSIPAASVVAQLENATRLILDALENAPETEIGALDIIPAEDRRQILGKFSGENRPFEFANGAHSLFSRQAMKTPEQIALDFEGETVTYADLDMRSNRLANYLISQGIVRDCYVGVLMDRSIDLVVSILGILKSGACYIPIDSEFPNSRITELLRDVGPNLILAQQHLVSKISDPNFHSRVVEIRGGSVWPTNIMSQPTGCPPSTSQPGDSAFIIFTSGSSGKPKGCENTHGGLVNYLKFLSERFPLTNVDRYLFKSPISFDVSIQEIFWPLINGAACVVAKPGGHRDIEYLKEVIQRKAITAIEFVPSMLQVFLENDSSASCGSLKLVTTGGESLQAGTVRQLFSQMPWIRLCNTYGPTEAALAVTFYEINRSEPISSIPIGRPIPNNRIYILDEKSRIVPLDVFGELFIGGIQVGKGYKNSSALTAERFVQDPFSSDSGAKMYRTGDRARFLQDGNIEFGGRLDFQVKLRGMRIELGEIESLMLEDSRVVQAGVVVSKSQQQGAGSLIAYFVFNSSEDITDDLRDQLKKSLPEYMVPAKFIPLEALPLTPNGKVDRAALMSLADKVEFSGQTYLAPVGEIEATIGKIWEEVLKVARVGRNDSFFALGGHSLLATQMISRVRREFKLDIPFRSIFDAPTLKGFSEIASLAKKTSTRDVPKIKRVARG